MASSQDLYTSTNGPNGYYLGQINLSDCSFCPEMELPLSLFSAGMNDVEALPNGNIVATGYNGEIYVFNPPSNTAISTLILPGQSSLTGSVLAPNGNVYLSGYQVIAGQINTFMYSYNPSTNTLTTIGTLPVPSTQILVQPFFQNGILYSFISDLSDPNNVVFQLATVQLGTPMVITTLYTYTSLCGAATAVIPSGPYAGVYSGTVDFTNCSGSDLYDFDVPSNSTSLVCNIAAGFPYGLSAIPPGFPPPSCLCFTDAGAIPTPDATLCNNETFDFVNVDSDLDNNDLLQFILYTNPNNIPGSILATSNTPQFNFIPGIMQTGVVYYVAAIAGNNLNGNVDLNDPCLDVSDPVEVIWQPLPTVSFSATDPNVCSGNCITVNVSFTGTAPFTLSYADSVNGVVAQTFPGNTGSFLWCTPIGAASSSIILEALSLADGWCTCD